MRGEAGGRAKKEVRAVGMGWHRQLRCDCAHGSDAVELGGDIAVEIGGVELSCIELGGIESKSKRGDGRTSCDVCRTRRKWGGWWWR